jgi:hypothetical protein
MRTDGMGVDEHVRVVVDAKRDGMGAEMTVSMVLPIVHLKNSKDMRWHMQQPPRRNLENVHHAGLVTTRVPMAKDLEHRLVLRDIAPSGQPRACWYEFHIQIIGRPLEAVRRCDHQPKSKSDERALKHAYENVALRCAAQLRLATEERQVEVSELQSKAAVDAVARP